MNKLIFTVEDMERKYNQLLEKYYVVENALGTETDADEIISLEEKSLDMQIKINDLLQRIKGRGVHPTHEQIVRGFKIEPVQMQIAS